MNFRQFLVQAIEEERAEVMRDFLGNTAQLEGGLAGLEACRGKSPPELAELLQRAYFAKHSAFHATVVSRYWRLVSFFNEVEWICNLVSVILVNQEVDPIIQPTMKAALVAQRITKASMATN